MFAAVGTLLAVQTSSSVFPTIDAQIISSAISHASVYFDQLSNIISMTEGHLRHFEALQRRIAKVTLIGKDSVPSQSKDVGEIEVNKAQNRANGESQPICGTLEDGSISSGTGCVGSLDNDDWSLLFLEPMLSESTYDIFNVL